MQIGKWERELWLEWVWRLIGFPGFERGWVRGRLRGGLRRLWGSVLSGSLHGEEEEDGRFGNRRKREALERSREDPPG